jgi:Immunity protein 27
MSYGDELAGMTANRDDLQPHETELLGQRLDVGSRIVGDAVEDRIAWLIGEALERVAVAERNWAALYRDPRDGRLWELTYPWGEMHGGGPRRLRLITPAEARAKYGVAPA